MTERSPEQIRNPRLRSLVWGLGDLIDFAYELDALPEAEETAVGDVQARQAESLALLTRLHQWIGVRALSQEVDRIPESVLVERLRTLGASWVTIAGATDMNASGMHKRHRSEEA